MKELIEYIAKSISEKPDAVKVTEETEGELVTLTLEVDPEDKGSIIGKGGRVAQAMRTVLRVAAIKKGVRANLDIA
ncbi:MAG: KH domain-containing protein [Dehalococcoidia bacterium]|nr:KH domain-containing protein [Dehalococcoidia bacterium]